MVQVGQGSTSSKTSRRQTKPKQVKKRCLYCKESYKGSLQSKYCSKYHMEQASRCRKEALVEAFAHFLHTYGGQMMKDCCGVEIEISWAQALKKAEQCVNACHGAIRLCMEMLGYVYDEAERSWRLQRLLG